MSSRESTRPAALGMQVFVAADAVTFIALIAATLLARSSSSWTAPGDPGPSMAFGAVLTGLLLASSAALVLGKGARWSRATAALLGLGFVAAALIEWSSLSAAGLGPGNSRFADFFFVVTGYHMAHVAAGAVALVYFTAREPSARARIALNWYWHFVDAIWIFILVSLY